MGVRQENTSPRASGGRLEDGRSEELEESARPGRCEQENNVERREYFMEDYRS